MRTHRFGDPRAWLLVLAGLVIGALLGGTVPSALRSLRATTPELLIASGLEESSAGARQAVLDLWNQANPDRPARFVTVLGTADEQHETMIRYGRGEQETKVDVLALDVVEIAEFAANDWITAWPGDRQPTPLLDQLLDGPRQSCTYDGKLWALPFNTDAGVLFARPQALGGPAGQVPDAVPWQRIEATADRLPQGMTAAWAGQLDDYEGLTVNLVEALWAVERERHPGGAPDPGPLGVPTDPATWQAAVQRLSGPAVDPGSRLFREVETTEQFAYGKVAYMRNWPVALRALREKSDRDTPTGDVVLTGLPGPAALGGQNLAVAAGSPRGDDARDLIAFLASEPSQRLLMQLGGYAAATRATYDRPEIEKAFPGARTVRAAVETSRRRPQTPHYPLFSSTIRELFREIRDTGKVPPDLPERLQAAYEGRLTPPK